jgi:acyl-CoA thioesterase-2
VTHAVHFHRPVTFTDWNLYKMTSPSAAGGLGYTTGSFFGADGSLVASTVQEGLAKMRPKKK